VLISSRTNEKIKNYFKVSSNILANHPWFVVEGEKLIREVSNSPHRICTIFVLQDWEEKVPQLSNCKVFSVTPDVMKKLTALTKPTWITALCRRESEHETDILLNKTPWIVLDGIQDPGNVGTIFRSIEAFGTLPLILLPSSPHPFHSKVIRASAGSALRVPYWRTPDHSDFLKKLNQQNMTLWALIPDGDMDLSSVPVHGTNAFLIGNEGHGPSPVLSSEIVRTVRVPMAEGVNSLNAATTASILLYHLYQGGRYGGHTI